MAGTVVAQAEASGLDADALRQGGLQLGDLAAVLQLVEEAQLAERAQPTGRQPLADGGRRRRPAARTARRGVHEQQEDHIYTLLLRPPTRMSAEQDSDKAT